MLTLLDEVRYECSTIVHFNLPSDFFPGVIQKSTKETGRENTKRTAPKRKRKANKYSAAARKKDKERKRKERNLKKHANQKEDSDAIPMISENKQDVFVKHNALDNGQFQQRQRSQGQIF